MTKPPVKHLDHCPECGFVFKDDFKIPRSVDQHRAFYRMVGIAVENWPTTHEFQPEGLRVQDRAEHMRHWLLCQAGHRLLIGEPWDSRELMATPKVLADYTVALMRAARQRPTWAVQRQGKIYIVQSKSIAFDQCSHEQFRPVFDHVQALIEETLDIKIEFTPQEKRQLAEIGIER